MKIEGKGKEKKWMQRRKETTAKEKEQREERGAREEDVRTRRNECDTGEADEMRKATTKCSRSKDTRPCQKEN